MNNSCWGKGVSVSRIHFHLCSPSADITMSGKILTAPPTRHFTLFCPVLQPWKNRPLWPVSLLSQPTASSQYLLYQTLITVNSVMQAKILVWYCAFFVFDVCRSVWNKICQYVPGVCWEFSQSPDTVHVRLRTSIWNEFREKLRESPVQFSPKGYGRLKG